MSDKDTLVQRCGGSCELCGAKTPLEIYQLPDSPNQQEVEMMLCSTCLTQLSPGTELDSNHWRCLNDSMWSTVPPVQVLAWRLLKRLSNETWAQDLLDMLYLDEEMQAWAEAGASNDDDAVVHRDCNGAVLQAGDSVVIIKDLNVKGTSFVAKRGTAVRNISLTDNPEHIEGRVNGTRIVILTCFVKKS
jgi:protein PhnA